MPAARRVDPKSFFTADEWARLSSRSRVRGPLLILHCYAVMIAAGAAAVAWPNPLTLVLAVAIIGARQLGLAILVHEAAHGQLHPNLAVNDALGRWLCGAPVGANLARYRPYHLTHHKFAQQPEDPDLGLSAPFPITRGSLRRKMLRDLTGRTFFKQRLQPTLEALGQMRRPAADRGAILRGLWGFWGDFLITNAVIAAVLVLAGAGWAYLVLWILPMATWYPLVTRLRNIAEHACTPSNEDPLRHARTTRANLLERALIAPYYVNYHCEHHMFMHLPCWRLPQAHRLLRAKGATRRMEVRDGYVNVIRLAAGRAEGPAAPPRPGKTPARAPFA